VSGNGNGTICGTTNVIRKPRLSARAPAFFKRGNGCINSCKDDGNIEARLSLLDYGRFRTPDFEIKCWIECE
jgi:hypothetical protein